jgi:hypothetical protein
MSTPQNQLQQPSSLNFDGIVEPLTKHTSRAYDQNRPDNAWSLDRLGQIQSDFQKQFNKPLPLVNRGQGSIHNRWGYDHRNAADVSLNPTSAEGQWLRSYLKTNNAPFLAFDRAIPGVATSAHIHLGLPSQKTQQKFTIGAQQKSKPSAGLNFDGIVEPAEAQQPAPAVSPSVSGVNFDGIVEPQPKTEKITSEVKPLDEIPAESTSIKPLTFQQGNDAKPISPNPVEYVYDELTKPDATPRGVAGLQARRYEAPDSRQLGERVTLALSPHLTPSEDDVVQGYLSTLGPQYVSAGEKYKAQTGHSILTLGGGALKKDDKGNYYIRPSKGAIDFINTYVQSGGDLNKAGAEAQRQADQYIAAQNKAFEESKPDIREAKTAMQTGKDSPLLRGMIGGMAGAANAYGSVIPGQLGNEFQRQAAVERAATEQINKDAPLTNTEDRIKAGIGGLIPTAAMLIATHKLGPAQLPTLGFLEGSTPQERLRGGLQGATAQALLGGAPAMFDEAGLPTTGKVATGAAMVAQPATEAWQRGESPTQAITENLPFAALPFIHGNAKVERPTELGLREGANESQTQTQPNVAPQPESAQSSVVSPRGTDTVATRSGERALSIDDSDVGTPQAQPRHVDLQRRLDDGTFGKETNAEKESRQAQVNPAERTNTPLQTSTEVPLLPTAVEPVKPSVPEPATTSPLNATTGSALPESGVSIPQANLEALKAEFKAADDAQTRIYADSRTSVEERRAARARLETAVAQLEQRGVNIMELAQSQRRAAAPQESSPKVEGGVSVPQASTVEPSVVERLKELGASQATIDTITPEQAAEVVHKNRTASWMVINKTTGELVTELYGKGAVDKLNTAKYEAVPIEKYLSNINEQIAKGATGTVNYRNLEQPSIAAPLEAPKGEVTTKPAAVEAPKTAEPIAPQVSEPAPVESQKPPEPPSSTTSARKNQLAADRAELDLPELPQAERKGWRTSLINAKEKGLDQRAERLADQVLANPRALDDEQTAGMVLKLQQLKNEHADLLDKIATEPDADQLAQYRADLESVEQSFDKITEAVKKSGSEKGRLLASQKLTINQDFDLVSMLNRYKAKTGKEPTPEIRAQIESQQKRIADLEKQLTEKSVKSGTDRIAREVRRENRQRTRKVLDEEAATIKTNLAAEFARLKAQSAAGQFKSQGGLGALDPDGVITKNALKYAKNRFEAGLTDATQLVDDVHGVLSEFADVTKRQVAEMISGYGGLKPRETKEQLEKTLTDLRKEMRDELRQSDIDAGVITERQQGPKPDYVQRERVKASIQKRIDELKATVELGVRTVQGKSESVPDSELQAMRAERDALADVVRGLDDPAASDKAIERALVAVDKSIASMEGKLASGDVEPDRPTVSPWSDELGQKRQQASELREQLNAARKAAEPKPDSEQVRVDNAIAAKTRAVEDIKAGKQRGSATSSAWSPELGKLGRELADLQKQRLDARNAAAKAQRAAGAEERQIAAQLKAVEKSIAETQARIDRHDLSVKARTSKPTSPELATARATKQELNKTLAEMRKAKRKAENDAAIAAGTRTAKRQGPPETKPQIQRRYQKQINEIQRRIAEQDFGPKPTRGPTVLDAETEKIHVELERAKQDFQRKLREWQSSQRTRTEKVADLAVNWSRAAKLMYVSTLGKLSSAATGRMVMSPIENLIGEIPHRLMPELSKRATTEGGGFNRAAEVAALWKSGRFRQVLDQLTKGSSDLDVLLGNTKSIDKEMSRGGLLGIPGRVHGAFKEYPRQAEFDRAFVKVLRNYDQQGRDITRPDVQLAARMEAFNSAERARFQQRNIISDGFNNLMGWFEQQGGLGKGIGKGGRFIFPITRVPVNVVGEAANYTFGLPRAAVEHMWRNARGTMTPEKANNIMRAYKKGGIGLAVMTYAFLNPKQFGGYYQKGDKRDPNEPQPGEVMFFGKRVPKVFTHVPILEAAQLAATARRVMDRMTEQGKSDAVIEGGIAAGKGLAEQVPFYETPARFFTGKEGARGVAELAGEQARGMIPGFVQEAAKATDKDKEGEPIPRAPQGGFAQRFAQTVKMGVPGLRQQVPINERKVSQQRKAGFQERFMQGKITEDDLDRAISNSDLTESDVYGDKGIVDEKDLREEYTPFQLAFVKINPVDANKKSVPLERFERMSAAQRAQVWNIMEDKADAILHSDALTIKQKEDFEARFKALGLKLFKWREGQPAQKKSPTGRLKDVRLQAGGPQ